VDGDFEGRGKEVSDGGKPVQTMFLPLGYEALREDGGGKNKVSPGFPLWCTVSGNGMSYLQNELGRWVRFFKMP
jgi:hypothetical protein